MIELEIQRSNCTPSQFLAYVRFQLRKKGYDEVTAAPDLAYWREGGDMEFDYHDIPDKPCKAEKSVSKPYQMQTFIHGWDGRVYNEICEFDFWDDKTGSGYYYLMDKE